MAICASCNQPGHSRNTSRLCSKFTPRTLICKNCYGMGHRTGNRICPANVSIGSRGRRRRKTIGRGGARGRGGTRLSRAVEAHNMCRRGTPSSHQRHDFGNMDQVCPKYGAKMWLVEKTDGKSTEPLFSLCCGKGKYIVEPIQDSPPLIARFLTGNDRKSKEF